MKFNFTFQNATNTEFFQEINFDHYGDFYTRNHWGIVDKQINGRKVGYSLDNKKFYDIKTGLEIPSKNISYYLMQDLTQLDKVIDKFKSKIDVKRIEVKI